MMNRRTLLQGLPLVAGAPLLAAQRNKASGTCSQGVEFAPSVPNLGAGNLIVAASPEQLNQQLEITCSMVAPFIGNRRQAELGFLVDETMLPSMLTQIGGNVAVLAHYFQSSGIAREIDNALREHALLGFHHLLSPSIDQVEGVSNMLAKYNVDLPADRVRQLLTVSLSSEEKFAITALLSSGESMVQFFLDGAGLFYQEANRLHSAGLNLSPALPRGRTTLPIPDSISGENLRKANKVIAGMALFAAVAGGVCYGAGVLSASPLFPAAATVAAAACPTAAVVGILAAGLRFTIT